MLAGYILGEPDTELTGTTVDTQGDADPRRHGRRGLRDLLDHPGPCGKRSRSQARTRSRAPRSWSADNSDITGVKDLAGKTVTTQTNSTSLTALRDQVPTAAAAGHE